MHTWRSAEALSLKRVTTAVKRLAGRLARSKSVKATTVAQAPDQTCMTSRQLFADTQKMD